MVGRLTSLAEVVDEDDLLQQDGGGGLQHTVDGPEQGGPRLVVERYDDGRGGQVTVVKYLRSTPVRQWGWTN